MVLDVHVTHVWAKGLWPGVLSMVGNAFEGGE